MEHFSSQSTTLERARQRGHLIVGVKGDMPPFGSRDVNGEFQGFEIDLGRDVASKLGLEFRPHAVVASNRIDAVREKQIDLLIASMVDLPQRREQVGVIDTPYYASPGIHVLARRDAGIRTMEDLRGRRVCGIAGSFYLDDISRRHSPELVRFTKTDEAEHALLEGRCEAWIYSDTAYEERLRQPAWADFELAIPPQGFMPWVAAVFPGEERGAFGAMLNETIQDWHHTGRFIELEQRWSLAPSPWLKEQASKYPQYSERARRAV